MARYAPLLRAIRFAGALHARSIRTAMTMRDKRASTPEPADAA